MRRLRIGIDGFGRMGSLVLWAGWAADDLEFVQLSEPKGDAAVFEVSRPRVLAWYDHEWGYANRLIELARRIGGDLTQGR